MKDIQKKIQKMIDDAVDSGKECGIQVTAYFEGELVVDAWGGFADPKKKKTVKADTLFPVFSTTKGIAATMIHVLAEEGKIDYDAKIAEYWPEFGVNGKKNITVRQALNHSAGLPNMPAGTSAMDLLDWNKMCARMAKEKPIWVPGTKSEYHAITYSWLVGEIACCIEGKSFSRIMEDKICHPLKINDMYVGIPSSVEPRVAILEETEVNPDMLKSPATSPIPGWICPLHEWMNKPEGRRACVPASSGIMSARAIARHYAALLPGGIDGVELVPPERMRIATQRQQLKDKTFFNRGLGYGLGENKSILGPRHTAFGHGGYGGSIGFADPKYRFAVGLTKNLYSKEAVGGQIICEIRRMLEIP
ncbi:MAG TPA: serine hydrolase [Lentisphaeria bacterium]|nr:serine hydrolase [Lentisphaeria bacterium]